MLLIHSCAGYTCIHMYIYMWIQKCMHACNILYTCAPCSTSYCVHSCARDVLVRLNAGTHIYQYIATDVSAHNYGARMCSCKHRSRIRLKLRLGIPPPLPLGPPAAPHHRSAGLVALLQLAANGADGAVRVCEWTRTTADTRSTWKQVPDPASGCCVWLPDHCLVAPC